MEQMDERIVAWERAKKKKELEEKWEIDVLRRGIKDRVLKLPDDVELKFSTTFYFAEKVPFIEWKDEDGVSETKEDAILRMNPNTQTVLLLIHLPEDMENISIDEWKSNIERDMKKAGKQVRNFQMEKLEYMDYLCYEICEKNVWTYNLVFRIHRYNRKVMGNYNCMLEDKKTYGRLLEALLLECHELIQRSE